jgi:hypothetical protein
MFSGDDHRYHEMEKWAGGDDDNDNEKQPLHPQQPSKDIYGTTNSIFDTTIVCVYTILSG